MISLLGRHKGNILSVALLLLLVMAALGMGFNPFYWRHPFENSSPSKVFTSQDRPLLRPTFEDLPHANESLFEKLDLYHTAQGNEPSPRVIWINGGGMTVVDKRSMPRRDFGAAPKPAPIG